MSDTPPPSVPKWAGPLWDALKLAPASSADEVLAKAGKAADDLAPDTRRMWRWILVLQGLAVLTPLLWLLVNRSGLAVSTAAYPVIVCTLLVVAVSWWLRWRGMQHAWAQARVTAEIARSSLASRIVSPAATAEALATAPGLRAIALRMVDDSPADPMAGRETYLASRVDDQLGYYRRKHRQALDTRRSLSRQVTIALDGALFLAVAGVWISFNPAAHRWLRLSGSDLLLGIVGAALPLIAILMQLLGGYLELNRRAGRYAQQIEFLTSARDRLLAATLPAEIAALAAQIERGLLDEVVEWFYQAQHSEPYYRSAANRDDAVEVRAAIAGRRMPFQQRLLAWLGISAGFIGRVVFGRVLVVALSVVVTTALIAFYTPKDSVETSRLRREDGKLVSSPGGDSWDPDPRRADHGFLLIAHGLHDSAFQIPDQAPHWMGTLQSEIRNRLGDRCPEICLVDWHFAAVPARASWSGFIPGASTVETTASTRAWLQDIASIRPQGEEIGDLVGYKLARALRTGRLRPDQPMHLVGHSAGGFVVVHAALVLHDLGLLPPGSRVTLLDTPVPSVPDLEKLAAVVPVDFYLTSAFAQGVPESGFVKNFMATKVRPPSGTDPYTGAHSFAHQWYIGTVRSGAADGFGLSPFAPRNP